MPVSIITIEGADKVGLSREDINSNFVNLNSGKVDTGEVGSTVAPLEDVSGDKKIPLIYIPDEIGRASCRERV